MITVIILFILMGLYFGFTLNLYLIFIVGLLLLFCHGLLFLLAKENCIISNPNNIRLIDELNKLILFIRVKRYNMDNNIKRNTRAGFNETIHDLHQNKTSAGKPKNFANCKITRK